MSFQENAESWRSKMHLDGIRLPVLVGLTAIVLLVLIFAARLFLDATTSESFAVENHLSEASLDKGSNNQEQVPPKMAIVHVSGAVVTPGVYQVAQGSRVNDAIVAAGGFAQEAATDSCNLAREVADGEQIVVATIAQQEAEQTQSYAGSASATSLPDGVVGGKVNINTATVADLDTLPGVGASTAEKIIADREANGPFKAIEDLQRVSGIGEKKYAALADAISVG